MKNCAQTNEHQVTMHGVFIEVFKLGLLLTGVSGIGKSELALGLINRGHALVVDDSVQLTRDNKYTFHHHPHPIDIKFNLS